MRQRVLVVDDDALIRRVVATVLDLEEYEVLTATSAAEAMKHLADGAADAVVSDVRMPDGDGFDLCSRIRELPGMARVPIILLTASAAQSDRDRARDVGSDAYLTKPFSPLELIEIIDRLIDERR